MNRTMPDRAEPHTLVDQPVYAYKIIQGPSYRHACEVIVVEDLSARLTGINGERALHCWRTDYQGQDVVLVRGEVDANGQLRNIRIIYGEEDLL